MKNRIKIANIISAYKDINKSKLSKKVVLFILAVILIPIIIIDSIAVTISYDSLVNKTKDSIFSAVQSSADYYDSNFKFTQDMSLQIVTNDMFMKYYSSNLITNDDQKEAAQKNVQKLVSNIQVINKFCSGVYILTDDQTSILYPNDFTYALDFNKIKSSSWYKDIVKKEGEPIWVDSHFENFDSILKENNLELSQYASALGRSFVDNSTNNVKGVILIDISKETLSEELSKNKLSKNGYIAIATPGGEIITPSEMKGKILIDKEILNKINKSKGAGFFTHRIANKNILISYTISKQSGWKYIGIVPIADIVSSAKYLAIIIILFTLIFTLIAVLIGIYFAVNISKDIKTVTNALAIASSGDLTVNIDVVRNDEIGELSNSFNRMIENIRNLILEGKELIQKTNESVFSLISISNETTKTSNEVTKAIQDIAQGAGEQAEDASKVMDNVVKFGQRIDFIVEASKEMDVLSQNILKISNDGIQLVKVLNSTTNDNYAITMQLTSIIKVLGEYTVSIGKIVNLLNSISEQTKLLALNASIEAAKANEYGRGFAVVATEIRKLADQSKNSTKEIEDIIKKIIKQINSAQKAAINVEDILNNQTKSVSNTSELFINTLRFIEDLSNKIENIYNSIGEIDKEKEIIIKGVENISSISQETAASSQEVAASTEEQLAAIEELNNIAENLSLLSKNLEKAMEVFIV